MRGTNQAAGSFWDTPTPIPTAAILFKDKKNNHSLGCEAIAKKNRLLTCLGWTQKSFCIVSRSVYSHVYLQKAYSGLCPCPHLLLVPHPFNLFRSFHQRCITPFLWPRCSSVQRHTAVGYTKKQHGRVASVRLGSRRCRFKSSPGHGSLLGDCGPVNTLPNPPHRLGEQKGRENNILCFESPLRKNMGVNEVNKWVDLFHIHPA